MRFRWSLRVNLIGIFFVAVFLRLSYWQWQRHLLKLSFIEQMHQRVEAEPANLNSLVLSVDTNWNELNYRRAIVSGTYDFSHEMLLRNRKYLEAMGVHALTPLKLDGTDNYVLVDRGFIPLSKAELNDRAPFQKPAHVAFTGLLKAGVSRRFLAPSDPPTGVGNPWVEKWLRVDLENISKQLPYQILPVFLEIVQTDDSKAVEQKLVDNSASSRDEMFMMAAEKNLMQLGSDDVGKGQYPLPVFDTIISPGRHLGYVFEWAIMALMVVLMCLVLQLRRGPLAISN